MPKRLEAPPADTLRSMYEERRMSSTEIGKRLGVDCGTVLKWLRQCGVEVRDQRCGLCYNTGHRNPHLGRKGMPPTPESREKQRIAMLGKHSLEKHPQWKGGRTNHPSGYVLVKRPGHPEADENGYVFEHRLVAEQVLGRRLLPGEVVHHLNGIKNDNRPENLQVMSGGEHTSHHHKGKHRSEHHRQKCRERQIRYRDSGKLWPWEKQITAEQLQTALESAGSLKEACASLAVSKATFYAKVRKFDLVAWYTQTMEAKKAC